MPVTVKELKEHQARRQAAVTVAQAILKEIKIASNPPPVAGTSEHARLLSLIEQQSSISKVYFDELKLLDGLWREFVLTRRMLTWDDFRDQDSN